MGCPGGRWPAVCYFGRCTATSTDSRGDIITSSQPIAGGQSGGAIFDRSTGYLIGVTNWGPAGKANYTDALAVTSWADTLLARLK